MLKPVIVLVGRPNVGKSTLFNTLTHTCDALVDDQPGVTRDRLYGDAELDGKSFIVVDTGGVGHDDNDLEMDIARHLQQVLKEADHILFMVDGRKGISAYDEHIASTLRQYQQKLSVVVNKTEGVDADTATSDFQRLGLGAPFAISAKRGDGLERLVQTVLKVWPAQTSETEDHISADESIPTIAVVGKPNVGKSTLINRLLGEERVIVQDQPGTTRDSVFIPFRRNEKTYQLIDTAGVRRKARVRENIEKYSVIKTIQAIDRCHVAIMLIDAREGVTEQDATICGMILDAGRSMVLAVNKWDGLEATARKRVRIDVRRRLPFLPRCDVIFISALHGSGVGDILPAVDRAYESASLKMPTSLVNRYLGQALRALAPPVYRGRPIKLKYAQQSGVVPPTVDVFGNQVQGVPASYRRYLSNYFSKAYGLSGTRVRIRLRNTDNPYAGRARKKHKSRSH